MEGETNGDLVKVASASDEAEAELIQGLLQSEGVTSVLRRTQGFDVPDFLAAGPRDVLVSPDQAGVARDVLQPEPGGPSEPSGVATTTSRRVLAGALLAVTLVMGVLCVAAVLWI